MRLPARATLVLYTDGLVERRGQPLDEGIARAAELARDGRASALHDLACEIMSRLAPIGGYLDDVALLLYRQPAPLEVDFPADASHLAPTRDALRGWLTRAGLEPDQAVNVLIAVGEAVANAVEHGHRDNPDGTISLRATAAVDHVTLTVTDTGTWKTPQQIASAHRGRGIALMRALMDDVTIQPEAAGTSVHLHTRIS